VALQVKYQSLVKSLNANVVNHIYQSQAFCTDPIPDCDYVFEQPNFTLVSKGYTQLMIACLQSNLSAYHRLIDNGADVLQKTIPFASWLSLTPEYDVLSYAVAGGNSEIVENLLDRKSIVENLSVEAIKAILLQIIVHDKKFSQEFSHKIVLNLIHRALLPEKATELRAELSLLFIHAIQSNNILLANTLVQASAVKKIDLVCKKPDILVDCIKENNIQAITLLLDYKPNLMIKSYSIDQGQYFKPEVGYPLLDVLNSDLFNEFLIRLDNIPLQEKLSDTTFVERLKEHIIHFLYSNVDKARGLLDSMKDPSFNVDFLYGFTRYRNYESIKPHLSLIAELSKNIASTIVELKLERIPLLFNFLRILNASPVIESKNDFEEIAIVNNIVFALINSKDALEILKYKGETYYKRDNENDDQHLLFKLLQYAERNLSNKKIVLNVLKSNYPGNIELRDNSSENVLMWAIKNSFSELLDLLLEKGAKLSDKMKPADKSALDCLCGSPAYIESLTLAQAQLLEKSMEKESLVETLEVNKYVLYLQEAISNKAGKKLDIRLINILMRYANDYARKLSDTELQSSFGTFVQTVVDTIALKNDNLMFCGILLQHPVFKQYFSDQHFEKIKNALFDERQYSDPVRSQTNFDLLVSILEVKPAELNDFPKLVTCCLKAPKFEQKSEGGSLNQIFNLFLQNFSVDALFNSADNFMQQLVHLRDDLFVQLINTSVDQYAKVSKETQEIIRIKILEILNCATKEGAGFKIKHLLTVASDLLSLDKSEHVRLLNDFVAHSTAQIDPDVLKKIFEILDLKSILESESQKENLLRLSIDKSNSVFLEYLLSNDYLNTFSPEQVGYMIEKKSIVLISKLLKQGIAVDQILTAMCEKNEAELMVERQASLKPLTSFRQPAFTIVAQFIRYQLSHEEKRVGEELFERLCQMIGFDVMGKTVTQVTGILLRTALYVKTTKAQLLALTTSPILCASVLKHFNVDSFSALGAAPWTEESMLKFFNHDCSAFEDFGRKFDLAAKSLPQDKNPKPQS
jgi:ankyrin repeat protein